ncbi:MAG: hypothetical protein R3D28_23660 [Geminicoccaceae bacterium]|jgi:mono/diheme cytochrome c family protein|nr:hypothetical protein [Geminicoccaceae bacterium]
MTAGAALGRAFGAVLGALALASALLPGAAPRAQGIPGDAAAGRELASRLCSGCHLIDNRQRGPALDGVPTFPEIARRLPPGEIELRLAAPSHPVMPQPPLDTLGRAHILAWFATLAD